MGNIHDILPDVRDGLNRKERMVLWVLHKAQKEFAGRSIPTTTLYGRVVEHIDMSVDELQTILRRLGAQVVGFARRATDKVDVVLVEQVDQVDEAARFVPALGHEMGDVAQHHGVILACDLEIVGRAERLAAPQDAAVGASPPCTSRL